MLPYWLLFGFFAAGALLSQPNLPERRRLGSLWLAWLVITLMVGLRWEVGPDWKPYLGWWNHAELLPLDRFLRLTRSDPAFNSLMWFFRATGASYWMFNFVLAGVFATGLVQFARTQVNPWLAIAVAVPWLVIVVAMSGVRQAAALAFIFLSITALQRQKGWKFLSWIALAACFHASAILVLPLAGLSFARSRLVAGVLVTITAVAAYYFLSTAFNIYSERYFTRVGESSGTLFRIAMTVLPALAYFGFRRQFQAEPHERALWRNLSLAGLIALPLYFVVASSTALDRLLLYLFPLQMYVLSTLPSILGGRGGRPVITTVILTYLAMQLFVFMNYGVNRNAFLPYQTIFASEAA